MERIMSVEDRIKRAEEMYYRKKQNENYNIVNNYARVPVKRKKNYKIYKKMIVQIVACLFIYLFFYYCINNNYVFSKDLANKAKEVLSYDMNFKKIYNNTSTYVEKIINKSKSKIDNNSKEQNIVEQNKQENSENIENNIEAENNESTEENVQKEQPKDTVNSEINEQVNTTIEKNQNIGGTEEKTQELSQMEQDCIDVQKISSFIVPVQGYVSSPFGWRDSINSRVPKNHMGLDIAAVTGTEIKSATNGTVILASSQGDYGNHLKIQIEDVITVYAHCSVLCVKEGDYVVQGQKIAEVGSTGNSTGPHLHFEIRKSNRFVDPQMILDI